MNDYKSYLNLELGLKDNIFDIEDFRMMFLYKSCKLLLIELGWCETQWIWAAAMHEGNWGLLL